MIELPGLTPTYNSLQHEYELKNLDVVYTL